MLKKNIYCKRKARRKSEMAGGVKLIFKIIRFKFWKRKYVIGSIS